MSRHIVVKRSDYKIFNYIIFITSYHKVSCSLFIQNNLDVLHTLDGSNLKTSKCMKRVSLLTHAHALRLRATLISHNLITLTQLNDRTLSSHLFRKITKAIPTNDLDTMRVSHVDPAHGWNCDEMMTKITENVDSSPIVECVRVICLCAFYLTENTINLHVHYKDVWP